MPSVSVIICTHNPREDYLTRTLNALRKQSLPYAIWELLLIDNCSSAPVSEKFDVTWHPYGRIVQEDELGLTPARLRGIRESNGEIICFVDDDNVLETNYLQESLTISTNRPELGCWGGEILPDYETPPPAWFKGCEGMLVIRPLQRDRWGNAHRYDDAMPCGAGLCIRRNVVNEYLQHCEFSLERKALDRRGNSTESAGDLDMAFTAVDMGMGTARFKSLQILHLIPTGRLTLDYIAKLAEGMEKSIILLEFFRSEDSSTSTYGETFEAKIYFLIRWVKATREIRRILSARRRGAIIAYQIIFQIKYSKNISCRLRVN